ncbi:MAG TPA: glycosyltransferase family 2 protein [Stellaceae bacterium]|nr:glycosyltransferase family 2 protein [Stellaceae bacterium]
MRLDDITPVILTRNEEPNIGRTLERLGWAKDIVVVDSGSDDGTLEILRRFPSVRVFQHPFREHAEQWRYALNATSISTSWVLGLDADYIVSGELVREIEGLVPEPDTAGYEAAFRYCVLGHPLPRSIYPPRIVLFRPTQASYVQDGHTQRLSVSGRVRSLRHLVDHDDRKSLTRWVGAQDAYARLERDKLLASSARELGRADRIRLRRVLAPIAVLLYCLFAKRMLLAGPAGWYYTYQRVVAELLLSLYLIEDRLVNHEPR